MSEDLILNEEKYHSSHSNRGFFIVWILNCLSMVCSRRSNNVVCVTGFSIVNVCQNDLVKYERLWLTNKEA